MCFPRRISGAQQRLFLLPVFRRDPLKLLSATAKSCSHASPACIHITIWTIIALLESLNRLLAFNDALRFLYQHLLDYALPLVFLVSLQSLNRKYGLVLGRWSADHTGWCSLQAYATSQIPYRRQITTGKPTTPLPTPANSQELMSRSRNVPCTSTKRLQMP